MVLTTGLNASVVVVGVVVVGVVVVGVVVVSIVVVVVQASLGALCRGHCRWC